MSEGMGTECVGKWMVGKTDDKWGGDLVCPDLALSSQRHF